MDLSEASEFLNRLADSAEKAIMPHFRALASVENKAGEGFDPVTVADQDAEIAIRDLIAAEHPGHGIVGEEFGDIHPEAEHVWVLDPIDGTRAFISGLPVWGTLIGLTHRRRPILGMMAQHFTGERFSGDTTRAWYTGPGGPADLKSRACARLADAVMFTTSPYLFSPTERPYYRQIEAAVRLARYGCDCYAYAMVAAGHADIVIEAGLNPYDIVALIPVIEGAGGRVTTWDGGSAERGGRIVATGDPRLHDEVLTILASAPAEPPAAG